MASKTGAAIRCRNAFPSHPLSYFPPTPFHISSVHSFTLVQVARDTDTSACIDVNP